MMNKLISSVSPHFHTPRSTQMIMLDVIIALAPAEIAAAVIFGWRALLIVAVCAGTCVLSEFLFEKLCKRENTISDLSAVVTGMLLAFNLPVTIPIWQAALGSVIAIIVVAFSGDMTTWIAPGGFFTDVNASTSATPLKAMTDGTDLPSYLDLFLGRHGGSLGETCALALILGGVYLLVRRVISWHTPVAFIGTVALMSLVCGKDVLGQVLSGGLLLAAFFMATDYATTPNTNLGKIIFGVGCGLITILIRFWGNYPEGVSYSILIMNILTPYISKLTRSKPLVGGVEE